MRFSRIYLIYIFIILFAGVITARLVFLQVINGDLYRALAKGQQEIFNPILGNRGEIYLHDKQGLVLAATNQGQRFCFASPRVIKEPETVAEELAPILGLEKERLVQQLSRDTSFVSLKRRLTQEEIEAVMELNIEGIFLRQETSRYYPFNESSSTVLGFVNDSGHGQYGVEGYWDDVLLGREGWQRIRYGPFGRFLNPETGEIGGENLVLTIDKNIQARTEELLENFSERFGYETAQIAVMEPATGRILALADFPFFNPNNYREYAVSDIKVFQNRAIQDIFEPGSVFKTMTMAAGINEGKITPESTYIDHGYVDLPGGRLFNYDRRVWGENTMTEALEKSINTGAVFVQQSIDDSVFLEYLEKFGIFNKTNIELHGEVFSENREVKRGYKMNLATASFGHGIDMNLLQLARAYGAIANKGEMVQPYIVEGTINQGRLQEAEREQESIRIINRETAEEVTKMLVSVTESGYGKPAKVPGYYVAGKTGTSLIPFSALGINQPGYSSQTWQMFAGFAPAFDPRFVIAIKLDNPGTRTASESATFIFSDLAKYILDYYQIPPDVSD